MVTPTAARHVGLSPRERKARRYVRLQFFALGLYAVIVLANVLDMIFLRVWWADLFETFFGVGAIMLTLQYFLPRAREFQRVAPMMDEVARRTAASRGSN